MSEEVNPNLVKALLRRPRVPGPIGPDGREVMMPVNPVQEPSGPAWLNQVQPYPVNAPAAIEGLMMAAGATGGPAGAMMGAGKHAYEAAAASPAMHKLATALGMGGAGAAAITPSQAGDPRSDPRISKIQELDVEIAGHRKTLEKQATTNFQSKTARENASKPYLEAISAAQARKSAIETEIDAEASARANSSFAKAHPTLNAAWPAIQWGGPVLAAMLTRGAGNLYERGLTKPWRDAVNSAEKAFVSGNDQMVGHHAGKAVEHLKDAPGRVRHYLEGALRETVVPTVAGGAVGMEAALFKDQYNRSNAPEGSPERLAAEKALGEDFWETAKKGLAPGVLGGFTGAHLPNIGPGYRPIAETKNLEKHVTGGGSLPPGSSGPGGQPLPSQPAPGGQPLPSQPVPGAPSQGGPSQPQLGGPPQGQPPAPAVPPNLLEALMKAPAPANRNIPRSATDRDIVPGVDKHGRPYHKDVETGHFAEKPKKPD